MSFPNLAESDCKSPQSFLIRPVQPDKPEGRALICVEGENGSSYSSDHKQSPISYDNLSEIISRAIVPLTCCRGGQFTRDRSFQIPELKFHFDNTLSFLPPAGKCRLVIILLLAREIDMPGYFTRC